MTTKLEIGEGGFLEISGNASVKIDGVELNPQAIKKEPTVELTIDDAKQCLLSISLQHALFKSRYGANDRTVVRLEEIGNRLGSSISQAEGK